MTWKVILSRKAGKDARKLAQAGYKSQAEQLLNILETDPYQPSYEKLVGNLKGLYSRRITSQHRLVYEILEEDNTVHVLRMWTHYE